MFFNEKTYVKKWTPAVIGTDETTAIMSVKKGWAVTRVYARWIQSSEAGVATSTVTLGDEVDPDGYLTATNNANADRDIMGANVDRVAGDGAYLAASAGKIYDVDDTIDVVYANLTEGAIKPIIEFTIVYARVTV